MLPQKNILNRQTCRHTNTNTPMRGAHLGFLPVCPVLLPCSEADWPSGMPCCLVLCRLEMIVDRSLSRLVDTHTNKGGERERKPLKSAPKSVSFHNQFVKKPQPFKLVLLTGLLTTDILRPDSTIASAKHKLPGRLGGSRVCVPRQRALSSEVCNAL